MNVLGKMFPSATYVAHTPNICSVPWPDSLTVHWRKDLILGLNLLLYIHVSANIMYMHVRSLNEGILLVSRDHM